MPDAVSRRVHGIAVYERSAANEEPPWVVLVHGSMDRGASFLKAARRLPSVGIVRYDPPGYGRSSRSGTAAGIDEHVADLLAVIDSVDGVEPGVVVGHSF